MTNKMIISRLTKVADDLKMDIQTYATQHHVTLEAADEVRRGRCADMCELIAEELREEDDYM